MPRKKIEKRALIKACMTVFREKGYYNTSIDDLSKATGLSKALFYHHFENKEALLLAALKMYADYFYKNVFEIAFSELEAKEKLNQITTQALTLFTSDYCGCLIGNTAMEVNPMESVFDASLHEFFDTWVSAMGNVFKENTQQTNPTKLAERSIALIEGALLLTKVKSDSRYVIDAFEEINTWVA